MDIYHIIFALIILSYACYSDLRTRSVSNIVWLVMVVIGIVFAGYYSAIQGSSFFIPLIITVVITGVVSYIFFRSGLFGAADAKALMCLAVLFPTSPEFTILSHSFPLSVVYLPGVFPFAFIVLLNAAVLALIVPVYLFIRNIHSLGVKEILGNASICFVAYSVNIGDLQNVKFARLTHTYGETNGKLTRRFSLHELALKPAAIARLKAYHGEGKIEPEVWVSPELPFMLFITLGFMAGCVLGL
jgi:archaeal preflagellin peptidase FlaK